MISDPISHRTQCNSPAMVRTRSVSLVGFKTGPCITHSQGAVTTACATGHVLMPPHKHPKTQHYLHLLHKEWHCKTFRPCLLYKSTLVVYKRYVYRSLPYTRQLLTCVSTTECSMYIQKLNITCIYYIKSGIA